MDITPQAWSKWIPSLCFPSPYSDHLSWLHDIKATGCKPRRRHIWIQPLCSRTYVRVLRELSYLGYKIRNSWGVGGNYTERKKKIENQRQIFLNLWQATSSSSILTLRKSCLSRDSAQGTRTSRRTPYYFRSISFPSNRYSLPRLQLWVYIFLLWAFFFFFFFNVLVWEYILVAKKLVSYCRLSESKDKATVKIARYFDSSHIITINDTVYLYIFTLTNGV